MQFVYIFIFQALSTMHMLEITLGEKNQSQNSAKIAFF